MKLCYRGATYNYENTLVEAAENYVVGLYRGATTKICQSQQGAEQRSAVSLKYRGAWVK
jgi:hypothetical protein